jgi:hypothetical protein
MGHVELELMYVDGRVCEFDTNNFEAGMEDRTASAIERGLFFVDGPSDGENRKDALQEQTPRT